MDGRGALRMGHHHSPGVEASNCEVEEGALVQKLVELHNASVRLALLKGKARQPVHFAEVCPGYCGENNLGSRCSPNCLCRVLKVVHPPIYLCFEEGKPLPLGFKES
ncbi:uncharacterized protein LOC142584113 isoform X2 [Dermacentor variabilis]|uniref:uncharacterized protein LOC142584113 isoform X2 n=1 Tax=Dermacentor variabilis TaxID=34621 RepID=UPI003F5C567F